MYAQYIGGGGGGGGGFSTLGDIMSTSGDTMSISEDILSTLRDVQYVGVFKGFNQLTSPHES